MPSSSTRNLLLSALLILALLPAGRNLAEARDQERLNRLLKGDYSFVLRQNCIVSPSGFESVIRPDGAETFRLLGDATNVGNLVRTGTLRFDGDGTGAFSSGANATLSIVAFGHPQTVAGGIPFQGINAEEGRCDLTYQVGADRMSFSSESDCTAPEPGAIIAAAPLRLSGRFDPARRMLILSHTKPNVETIEIICDGCGVAPDGEVLSTVDRVCNRSGSAIRMRGGSHEDGDDDREDGGGSD